MRSIIALTMPGFHHTLSFPKEIETRMAEQTGALQLTDDDVAFLLTLLRNATSPLSTEQLVDALKQRSSR
jgi:hypothetical protein